MAYTPATADQVRAITGSSLTDDQIQPFLSAAACVMASITACTTGKLISDDCLTQAEAWLASHLLSISNVGEKTRTKKRVKFENYDVEWAMSQSTGQGVKATNYGQTANLLTGGCLAEADKSPAVVCFFG